MILQKPYIPVAPFSLHTKSLDTPLGHAIVAT